MIATLEVPPAYRPAGLPVTAMVTGKAAVPEEDDATMPTEATVPKTLVALPVGVISAWSPFLREARSALPTDASTTHELVEMTTTSPVAADVPPLWAPPLL